MLHTLVFVTVDLVPGESDFYFSVDVSGSSTG